MSLLREFNKQYIIPQYGAGAAPIADGFEAGDANVMNQPHAPDLRVAEVQAGPTAPDPRAPLPLPANRGLTAIEITTNGRPYTLDPGGRMYLFPMGTFDDGHTEQLRGDLVAWNTDDPDTITVDAKGIATAGSYGKAKITVTEKSTGITSPAITLTVDDTKPAGDSIAKDKLPAELVKIYDKASLDYQTLQVKAQQMDQARQALPPENEIFEEIARNTSKSTTESADNLRMKKEMAQDVLGRFNDLKTWMEFFKKQQDAAVAKIQAEELLQDAAELRERAEQLKKATESVFKVIEDGLSLGTKIGTLVVAPELEVIDVLEAVEAGIHAVGDLVGEFHGSAEQMLDKAKKEEKDAHDTRLKALRDEVQNLANAYQQTEKNAAPTLDLFQKIADEAKAKTKTVEKDYDKDAKSKAPTKGKFQFALLNKPIELASAIVKTVAPQARKSAMDAYGALDRFEKTQKRSLGALKKDTLAWTRDSAVIAESAADALKDLAELQDAAHETMASAHDFDK
jgi:hypothetical protein